jgi:hypothetical protein
VDDEYEVEKGEEELVHLPMRDTQAVLLGSLETAHKEMARARCLKEVNAAIKTWVKEISGEQVAVDENGRRLRKAKRQAVDDLVV